MAYNSFVGSFNIDTTKTAGQTQAITGVGFQPKIVLFWWSGSTATGNSVSGGTINIGFGAAISSSSRFSIVALSEDAQATSDTCNNQDAASCITAYTDGDTRAVDGIMDFSSMDSDGFTLIVDDQFTNALRVSYLALGGTDLTNVYIGNKQTPAATGNFDTTDVGFQPDALILASVFDAAASGGSSSAYFLTALGMATSSSNQGVISGIVYDAVGTTESGAYGYNGECLSRLGSTAAASRRMSFVSFLSNGFRLNILEGTTQYYFHYIALKGGQYSVGDITTRTDGNDIAETVGFQPVALLFASANRALSTQDTPTVHARLSIGAATSASNRAVQAISDENGLADSETAYANYDTAVYAQVRDDAIVGLMDIKSIDASGFTAVMDDTDPSACWVTYLAIGAAASSEPSINKSEAITVSDTPTVSVEAVPGGDLLVDKSETVTAGETVTAQVGDPAVSVTDSASVTDTPTASVQGADARIVSAGEGIEAADAPTIEPLAVNASATQAVGVADTPTIEAATRVISVTDAAGVADTPTVNLPELDARAVSVTDSASLADAPVIDLQMALSAAEAVGVTDAPTVSRQEAEARAINVTDNAILVDTPTIQALGIEVSAADSITATDTPSLSLPEIGAIAASVSDGISVGETVTASLDALVINVTDTASVTDTPTASRQEAETRAASVSDTISLADIPTVSRQDATTREVNVSDTIAVMDTPTVSLPEIGAIAVSMAEAISAADASTIQPLAVNVSVSEIITVADIPTVSLPEIGAIAASVSESVAVGETVTINLGALVISVADAVSVTDTPTASRQEAETRAVSVSDTISLADTPTVSRQEATTREVNVTDTIAVADAPTVSLPEIGAVTVSVAETISAADASTIQPLAVNISVTEAVGVTDTPTVTLVEAGAMTVSVSDSVAVAEAVTTEIASLTLAMTEDVTVTDAPTVSLVEAAPDLAIAITPDSVFAVGVRIYP